MTTFSGSEATSPGAGPHGGGTAFDAAWHILGNFLALFQNESDGLVHRDIFGSLRDQNAADGSIIDGLDFHGGLVGLDLGEYIARSDGVALTDQPPRQCAHLHGG